MTEVFSVGVPVSVDRKRRWSYSATGLPDGMSIDSRTGKITGTPSSTGSGTATITSVDEFGTEYTRTFTYSVADPTPRLDVVENRLDDNDQLQIEANLAGTVYWDAHSTDTDPGQGNGNIASGSFAAVAGQNWGSMDLSAAAGGAGYVFVRQVVGADTSNVVSFSAASLPTTGACLVEVGTDSFLGGAMSDFSTTGSIAAGSAELTVTDASGFSVGDWVIVETGGEAGAGVRGTKGVGGTWPALTYADAAARDADTGNQSGDTACWTESDGNVWYRLGGGWSAPAADDYYLQKAIPRALVAQIQAKLGNKLTLSKSAAAAATNANVYFDNFGPLQDMIASSLDVKIPAGTYMVSCHIAAVNRVRIVIRGAGKDATILKTPKGCPIGGISLQSCNGSRIKDLQIDSGFTNSHYTMKFSDARVAAVSSYNLFPETYRSGTGWGESIEVYASSNCEVRNVIAVNPSNHGIVTRFGTDTWARNCKVIVEEPFRTYTQWMIQWVDCVRGGLVDCEVDANKLVTGFNQFKCRDTQFRRIVGRNTLIANNASDGSIYDHPTVTINDDYLGEVNHILPYNPLMEFSTNVGLGYDENPSFVINPTFVQEGSSGAVDPERLIFFTVTSSNACPVRVTGTYDTDAVTPKGLFRANALPDANANTYGGTGLRISGAKDCVIEGIRIIGAAKWPAGAGMVHVEGNATFALSNSIFDGAITGTLTNVTTSGNMTNAQYEAG